MYLSGSGAMRGSELDRNKDPGDSEGQLLFVSGFIVLIKLIHLVFGISLLFFKPGKNSLSWPKYENSILKKSQSTP